MCSSDLNVDAALPLLRALLEIRLRDPSTREVVEGLARDLAARGESWRGATAEADRAERALALAARARSPEESSPAGVIAEFARAVARDPTAPALAGEVAAFGAELAGAAAARLERGGEPRIHGDVDGVARVVQAIGDGELEAQRRLLRDAGRDHARLREIGRAHV